MVDPLKDTSFVRRVVTLFAGAGVVMCAFCGGRQAQQSCSTPAALNISSQDIALQARSATAFLGMEIVISSSDDACGLLYQPMPEAVAQLEIFLNRASAAGTFPIEPQWVIKPSSVGAWLAHRPASATPGSTLPDRLVIAQSGEVTFTRLDADRISGHYDISFPDGARAIGSFDTTYCRAKNACP